MRRWLDFGESPLFLVAYSVTRINKLFHQDSSHLSEEGMFSELKGIHQPYEARHTL